MSTAQAFQVESILLATMAGAMIVLAGALYAGVYSIGRISSNHVLAKLSYLFYAVLVVATLVLARTLNFAGFWNWVVVVMLVGYLVAPQAIWRLCVATHAEEHADHGPSTPGRPEPGHPEPDLPRTTQPGENRLPIDYCNGETVVNRLFLTSAAILLAALGLGAPAFANVEAEQTARTLCAGCHGPDGISTNPIWPNLAGQKDQYTAAQLRAYRDGTRADPNMSGLT